MASPTTLVITLSTASLRAAVLDEHGVALGSASGPYEMLMPQPGRLEQRPGDWWEALGAAVASSGEQTPLTDAAEVWVLGDLTGFVVLDGEDDIIRPAIIASDERLSGGAASAMSWLRQHQTIAYKRVQHLLTPLSYMRYRLTGTFVIDPADAETTGLFDAPKGVWSSATCDHAEINMDVLPAIAMVGEETAIDAGAAHALGLRDVVIVR
jgi:xylulokinase